MTDWTKCKHRFVPYFGTMLKCQVCGATTMVSMDRQSKPIYPPQDNLGNEVEANLTANLYIECPNCETDIDLFDGDIDIDGCFSTPIFNNKWSDVEGCEVECPHCSNIMMIKSVIY